ncbi:S41 family peptidase [Oceanirhabdus sp. W0125-5]|uniref:S41 family peptidase n=1 Tax=Oceanirhabdus sp. W0125-5 TaxID=2999116 RepID=UPI0022F2E8E3|nr:S41 family peptidase [Oceanirhabdus sp. W0125-5]WBW96155.1 S41 family peptidase [Oceanirhabdus sp. W0125-5]
MRRIHKILFMFMISSLFFVSCNNETVIINEVKNNQGEISINKENGQEKVLSVKEKSSDVENSNDSESTNQDEKIKQEINTTDENKEMVPQELEYIINLIEEIHPNPYKYVNKNEILEEGNKVFLEFSNEDEGEYLLYKRLISLYRDPAIRVKDLKESRRKLKVDLIGGLSGVYVSNNSEFLKKGDRVVKIGGMPIEDLLEIGMKYTSSNSKEELYCNLDNIIRDFNFLLDAGAINKGKVKVEVIRDGISICENVSFENESIEYDNNNSYETFDNNHIALLDINNYEGNEENNFTFQSFFKESVNQSVEKIVIDLRTDGHISMNIIDEIIKNLSYKDYYNYDNEIKKSSQWEESSYKDLSFIKKIFKGKKTKSKDKNSFTYDKEIFVLVNGNSGPDAIRVANLIKNNFYGQVIGALSNSEVNNFGNDVEIQLAQKNISISVPTTEFIYQGKGPKRLSLDRYSDNFNDNSLDKILLKELLYEN